MRRSCAHAALKQKKHFGVLPADTADAQMVSSMRLVLAISAGSPIAPEVASKGLRASPDAVAEGAGAGEASGGGRLPLSGAVAPVPCTTERACSIAPDPRYTAARIRMIVTDVGSQSADARHASHLNRSAIDLAAPICCADWRYTSLINVHQGGCSRCCCQALSSTTTHRLSKGRSWLCRCSRRKFSTELFPAPQGPCRCTAKASTARVLRAPPAIPATSSMRAAMTSANGRRASSSIVARSSECELTRSAGVRTALAGTRSSGSASGESPALLLLKLTSLSSPNE